MSTQPVKEVVRRVKPLLSATPDEARRRVIALYKAWYRQIPPTIFQCGLTISCGEARERLKLEFLKHKHVRDIRLIDMLVTKGQMELKEIVNGWKQPCHVMYLIKDTAEPRPKDFLSKFIAGVD